MSSRNPRADQDWFKKLGRRERFADFAYTLARVDWTFFSTHTYSNPIPRISVQWSMFWQWCQDLSKVCKVPYNSLLIALRREHGEKNGREHFHSLVGVRTSCNIISVQHQAVGLWRRVANGAALDCRLYDRSLAGADYMCKCLGANAYELNKFTTADEVTLSHAVFSVMRNMAASGDRRYRELIRKDRQVTNAGSVASSLQVTTASVSASGLSHPAPLMRAFLGA